MYTIKNQRHKLSNFFDKKLAEAGVGEYGYNSLLKINVC